MHSDSKVKKKLRELIKDLHRGDIKHKDIMITGVNTNSKYISSGDLFIAIKGNNQDGHQYIDEAINNGASAIILNGKALSDLGPTFLNVKNTRRAASIISSRFYDNPSKDLTIIGITGTNGKTTTAYLLKECLTSAGFKTAQIGTTGVIAEGYKQEKTLTTPDAITIQKLLRSLVNDGFSHVIMEVSSHALHQLRVSEIHFDAAVFTNLTPEHLDYHKTMENYFKSKSRLFNLLKEKNGKAIINFDDNYGKKLIYKINCDVSSFSKTGPTKVFFSKIYDYKNKIDVIIKSNTSNYKIESNLIGEYNLENILAAVTTLDSLKINKNAIVNGIKNCKKVPGRLESFLIKTGAKVIIDYAHTPDAYDNILGTLKNILEEKNNLYLVFGAGGDRDSKKRSKMAAVAQKYCNKCFITPDNPRFDNLEKINGDIISGFTNNCYKVYDNREAGINEAVAISKPGDIIAILGKGDEEYQDIRGKLVFHSDKKIIMNMQ